MRGCSWTCVTWLTCVETYTGGSCTVIAPCPSYESQAVAKKIFKHGFGGQDPVTYWCAKESEAWELLRCSRKNSQCQGLRCKQQLLVLRGRGVELSRGSQPSREWRARRFCNTKRHVSCQLRGCPRAESKRREVGHTPK